MIEQHTQINSVFHSSYEKFMSILDGLQSKEVRILNHRQLEDYLKIEGRELLRRLFQEQIDSLGSGDVGKFVVGTDSILRSDKREREVDN